MAHAAVLRERGHQLGHVDAPLVDDGAGVVLDRDDLRAGLGEQFGRRRADVAESLHRDARAVQSSPMRRAASRPVTNTPRPVALTRPSEPPRSIGLPVTTPVAVEPVFIE